MKSRTKIALTTTGVVAVLATIGLIAATASAAETEEKKPPYEGPGPNYPGGKRPPGTPKGPTEPVYEPPEDMGPADLWISPACDEIVKGEDWTEQTARPAVQAWVADGFGDPRPYEFAEMEEAARTGPFRVVREILGPYSPLCIDTWPWFDVYTLENYPPAEEDYDTPDAYADAIGEWHDAFNTRIERATAEYPALAELIDEMFELVADEWRRQYGGEGVPNA